MIEEMKKMLLAGVGGVVLSMDKLEQWKNRMVRENRLSEKETREMIDELVKAGQDEWNDLESAFSEMIRKRLHEMDVARHGDLENLRHRVNALEARISVLEQRPPSPAQRETPSWIEG